MLNQLSTTERLHLMKFVCSFAWADLEVRPEERVFIARLIRRLELSAEEEIQVHGWLDVPPSPDSVDPTLIPAQHRELFLAAIEGVIEADGEMSSEESDNLQLFRQLLH
ncbi:MAG: TerB family tellurite resistance protein [Myxococcota bacterium]|nr:TerB family tellurite resistance protein [Myxococcota bacterium]